MVRTTQPDIAALLRQPMLLGADPAVTERLAHCATWRLLEPNEIALDFGDVSTEVFFVLQGSLRVQLQTPDGKELLLNELGVGDIFGELAAIDGTPRSASITALHRTRLCKVTGEAFLECVLASPVIALRLLRMLAARLRGKDERVLELAMLPVRQRLIAELLRLSLRRTDGSGQRVLSPPPSHYVLGTRIGTRREVVSRELSALARAGLVAADRRAILLLKPETMRQELEAHLPGTQGPHKAGPTAASS
jgi:CRP/FNR family transcriptional regulator, cyclic AMP receptor protein